MKRKLFIYAIVFLFGMFVMPGKSYACTNGKSSNSHRIETSKKSSDKSCCDEKSSSEEKGCNKSCDDSKCHCTSLGGCISMVFGILENSSNFFIPVTGKNNNFHYNALLSKVFFTVWALPKIS
ncbi:hypothetical protein NAT51_03490 [Flavobacterium amniphilum]|uniref:hypothetical protein n=1 Tax=Flavobacterium amniphilum TaxID=1834035 RepID=UPI00202A8609|nr:hypothetical protein [Flavobacterium amniphilum]MCL9804569.1 hypothetical protein [Flavobacterium amniphilum]